VRVRRAALAAALAFAAAGAAASSFDSLRLCDRSSALNAAQQDRLLRFAAVIKRELEGSDAAIALVARSGLDLDRFGIRYSHAGLALRASENAPWSVRQLYYACDEARPRLFDQGIAGFVSGTDDPSLGHVSILLLPARSADAAALESAALDRARSLALVAGRYAANAHAWSLAQQNCNQWLIELMAAAGGGARDRPQAQAWLAAQGYRPADVDVGSHLWMALAHLVPWLTRDGHPGEDLYALRFRISLPSSIEAFVRERVPGVRRIELCHDERRVVLRRDGAPIERGCIARDGDELTPLVD
jgi:hypothetical protein